jgi:phage-related holin
MKDILNDVLSKIKTVDTLKSITDKGIEKLAASAIGATLWDLGTIFFLLLLLEIIDIFTACIYQSSLLWKKMYDQKIIEKRGNLLNYIKWIWQAHHWRFIDSFALRDGFCSKTIIYFLLIMTGYIIDSVMMIRHAPQLALTIVCGVLACTEGISICENLDSAGIKIAGELRDMLKKKKEGIK